VQGGRQARFERGQHRDSGVGAVSVRLPTVESFVLLQVHARVLFVFFAVVAVVSVGAGCIHI
jgi:hypothetical protein